jgi:hypothetical protein
MESQGITDPKLLEVARRIDAFAKTIKWKSAIFRLPTMIN